MVHPYWAWEVGSCGDLHDHLDHHACHGSSCYLKGPSSSREDDSRQETGDEDYGIREVQGWSFQSCIYSNKGGKTKQKTKPGVLTGGGWLVLGPDALGPLGGLLLLCPPPDAGTGASPSSAIRDKYSLSIRALS